jgi:PAS domain S-box-containing protein
MASIQSDNTNDKGGKSNQTIEMYRMVFERISDAFVALDNNWCYTYMNKKAGEIFNRNPEEMIGKHIWTEFPEGIDQKFYKAYHKALKEQIYIQYEEYYPPYNKWFVNHIYPSADGLSIYFNDITERKLEEENQRINERKLIKSQEIGNLGYWELERNNTKIWGSKKTLEIFGLPMDVEDVPVEKIECLITDFEKVKEASRNLIEKKNKFDIEFVIHPADGTPKKYISSTAEIENDLHGKPFKIIGVVKDITEQKNAEEKLLKALYEKTSILESISEVFFTLDKNWNIKYWNKEAERLLQINRESVINRNLWEVFPEEISTRFHTEFSRAINENKSINFEEYFTPANIWFKAHVYPNDGLCIFFQDITEDKRQEKLHLLEKNAYEFYSSPDSTVEGLIRFLLDGIKNIHPDMLCSVLKIKNGRMYNWSSPHLPDAYNKEVEGTEIGIGRGSCGSSAYLREKVEVSNISIDPYWANYRSIIDKYEMKSCWSYPIIDSNNNLLGTFGIYHNTVRTLSKSEELSIDRVRIILVNIIERKLAENEVKAFKDKLELIFNTSKNIIFLISVEKDNHYKFITINQPFIIATGLKKEEIEGKNIEEVIPAQSISLVKSKYQEAIKSGHAISWEEISDYPSGTKTGIVTISPVFNSSNVCINLVGTVHDISDRKISEEEIKKTNEELRCRNEELREKNMKLEEIAWVQSHKVRAPLARIMGLIDLITNHYTEETNTDELLKYVLFSAKELDAMIMEIVKKTEEV